MTKSLKLLIGCAFLFWPFAAQAQTPPVLDANALLASADANKDGSITKAEFIAERAKAFDRLDVSKDGFLTRQEFTAAAPAGMRRNLPATQFGSFDKNGDAKLSRDEFNAAPTPGFVRLDRDRNGTPSPQEIAAARASGPKT
jgi:hypothetical protein